MTIADISVLTAIFAGALSFLSPCVLPLVPPYLCYMAGVSLDQLTGQNDQTVAKRWVMVSSLAFVLGFSTIFVALGATASVIGSFVTRYSWEFGLIGGAIIVVMGLHFLGVFRIAFLSREARIQVRNQQAGPVGSYLVGLAFAIGWTPCIGPTLGAILTMAAVGTSPQVVGLLVAYSIGLGIPFILMALAFDRAPLVTRPLLRYSRYIEIVGGALVIFLGFALIFDWLDLIARELSWLIPSV